MACGREAVLALYRNLIKESKKWHSYNYRTYALRKIRHEFQENKCLQDKKEIKDSVAYGYESLEMIKRQALIGNLYATNPLVIEVRENDKVTDAKSSSSHENNKKNNINNCP